MDEEYLYIEIQGRPGLFHHKPIDNVPGGLHCYHLSDPNGYDYPEVISQAVDSDYWGSVFLREPIDLSSDEAKEVRFAFYEDSGGNPLPITAADYLAGVEPEPMASDVDLDEDDLCL